MSGDIANHFKYPQISPLTAEHTDVVADPSLLSLIASPSDILTHTYTWSGHV